MRPHQERICCSRTARAVFSHRPTGRGRRSRRRSGGRTATVCRRGVGAGRPSRRARAVAGWRARSRGSDGRRGPRPAGLRRRPARRGSGDLGQGGVEVGQVLPVRPQGHLGDTGVVDRLGVQGGVAGVEGLELGELAVLGVEPEHRLVEQPVEGHRPDLVRDRGTVASRWAATSAGVPSGPRRSGGHATPRRHRTGHAARPGAVGDAARGRRGWTPPGGGGAPGRGGERAAGRPVHRRDQGVVVGVSAGSGRSAGSLRSGWESAHSTAGPEQLDLPAPPPWSGPAAPAPTAVGVMRRSASMHQV